MPEADKGLWIESLPRKKIPQIPLSPASLLPTRVDSPSMGRRSAFPIAKYVFCHFFAFCAQQQTRRNLFPRKWSTRSKYAWEILTLSNMNRQEKVERKRKGKEGSKWILNKSGGGGGFWEGHQVWREKQLEGWRVKMSVRETDEITKMRGSKIKEGRKG